LERIREFQDEEGLYTEFHQEEAEVLPEERVLLNNLEM
jgi:hypothetical protein